MQTLAGFCGQRGQLFKADGGVDKIAQYQAGRARGDFTAVEVTTAALKRCRDRNGTLRAIDQLADTALGEARASDARASRRALIGALDGVPLFAKSIYDMKGLPTTASSAEWARLFYLEIWPSVFVSETDLRHSVDDFARVVLYLLRQGAREGDWPAGQDAFQTAAILMGGVNQVIITWLLYRRPRNLTKASIEIVERMLDMIAMEKPGG